MNKKINITWNSSFFIFLDAAHAIYYKWNNFIKDNSKVFYFTYKMFVLRLFHKYMWLRQLKTREYSNEFTSYLRLSVTLTQMLGTLKGPLSSECSQRAPLIKIFLFYSRTHILSYFPLCQITQKIHSLNLRYFSLDNKNKFL